MVVLKKLIVYSLYFGGGCCSLERSEFVTVSTYGVDMVVMKELIQRTVICNSFHLWGKGVVVLKKLISNSFNFGGG